MVPYGTTREARYSGCSYAKLIRLLRSLLKQQEGFVAPSANTSGRPSPTAADHVAEDLDGKIDMILDGGSVEIGLESAILDMTVIPPMILRPGAITADMFEKVIGTKLV